MEQKYIGHFYSHFSDNFIIELDNSIIHWDFP